jgi:hypothetical protein
MGASRWAFDSGESVVEDLQGDCPYLSRTGKLGGREVAFQRLQSSQGHA